jgi:cellobiose phosphorylase
VNHGRSKEGIDVYKVEPYVVAADVYAVSPHVGRGGWTWYTGSAGWMYRLITESLLGLRVEGDTLRLAPCLPPDWPEFTLRYRYRETVHHITVSQDPKGSEAQGLEANPVRSLTVDGEPRPDRTIRLFDDGRDHHIGVTVA